MKLWPNEHWLDQSETASIATVFKVFSRALHASPALTCGIFGSMARPSCGFFSHPHVLSFSSPSASVAKLNSDPARTYNLDAFRCSRSSPGYQRLAACYSSFLTLLRFLLFPFLAQHRNGTRGGDSVCVNSPRRKTSEHRRGDGRELRK